MPKKAAVYTLGCKLNQVDTETIRESFMRAGYEIVEYADEADVYVVNTCTVTGSTDHQARQMLRRALRRKDARPDVKVVITGCYAQTQPDAIRESLPELDLIVGNLDKGRIPALIDALDGIGAETCVPDVFSEKTFETREIENFSDYTRAFLRIQEGCNNRCAYCIVPYARGRSRSAPMDVAVSQARRFAQNGYREIVVAGIHIGRYGADLEPKTSLAKLLLELNRIDGLSRIRLSSIDPKEFSAKLFDALDSAREKLCPHFHISLQSGDDEILRAMKRDYTADEFAATVFRLRELFPDVSVGADVIVGFPGESARAFDATCELVQRVELSYLHVFRYSRRPGTPAADMPDQVGEKIKKQRSRKMICIRKELQKKFAQKFIGSDIEVLLETRRLGKKKQLSGLTGNYLRVYGDGPDELMGGMVTAHIAAAGEGRLEADSFSIRK